MKELVLPTLATVERYAKLHRVVLYGRTRSARHAWAYGTACAVRFLPMPEHDHLDSKIAKDLDKWIGWPLGELVEILRSPEICEADGGGTRSIGHTRTKIAEKHAKLVSALFPNVLWMPGHEAPEVERNIVRARDMGSEEFVAIVAPVFPT